MLDVDPRMFETLLHYAVGINAMVCGTRIVVALLQRRDRVNSVGGTKFTAEDSAPRHSYFLGAAVRRDCTQEDRTHVFSRLTTCCA